MDWALVIAAYAVTILCLFSSHIHSAVVNVSSAPSLMGHQQITYQKSGSERIVVWGGYMLQEHFVHKDVNNRPDRLHLDRITYNNEVYEFDTASLSWVLHDSNSTLKPRGRVLHSMSVSSDGKSFLLHGGTDCFKDEFTHPSMLYTEALKDVWRFNLESDQWTQLQKDEHTCSSALPMTTLGLLPVLLGVLCSLTLSFVALF